MFSPIPEPTQAPLAYILPAMAKCGCYIQHPTWAQPESFHRHKYPLWLSISASSWLLTRKLTYSFIRSFTMSAHTNYLWWSSTFSKTQLKLILDLCSKSLKCLVNRFFQNAPQKWLLDIKTKKATTNSNNHMHFIVLLIKITTLPWNN